MVVTLALPVAHHEQVQSLLVAFRLGVGQQVGVVRLGGDNIADVVEQCLAEPVLRWAIALGHPGTVRVEQVAGTAAPGLAVFAVLALQPGKQERNVEEQFPEVQTVGTTEVDGGGRTAGFQGRLW